MLWIKALHLITIITWFAGIFYLPRLFVYHTNIQDELSSARFKIMEQRLYYGIMMPSFILATLLGIWMIYDYAWVYLTNQYWLVIKLILVGLLIIYHFICGYFVKVFKEDNNQKSDKFYRIFNEIPVLLLISIIILVVVKPI